MNITVVIPSHKPKEYIWKCLDSLSVQSLDKSKFEVIVILNGCRYPYLEELERYKENTNLDLRIIQTDEGGVSNARNIGIDAAKGEYLTFIDDDDYVSPTYLERLYEVVAPGVVPVALPSAFYDETGEEWKEYPISLQYKKNAKEGVVGLSKVRRYFSGPCMKLLHKSFIQGKRFDKRFSVGEDTLFMFLISDSIKKVSFAKDDAIYYRRYRQGSLLMSKRNYKQRLKNQLGILRTMSSYYFPHFWKYNFSFSIAQFASVIKGLFR